MGNVSFGILEHIDIPGIKYDPKIGILGLNVTVRLARPGFSVATRSKHKASVGKHHKITPDEAKAYLTKEFAILEIIVVLKVRQILIVMELCILQGLYF